MHLRRLKSYVPALALLPLLACSGAEQEESETPAMPDSPMTLAGVGFATPESVRHDPVADVYLVSNINGDPFAEDGNGFISRVSPTGTVLDLKWIDGEAEAVTLNAPKGMAIVGDVLYVTDVTSVRMFNRETGEPMGSIAVAGSTFLNDAASSGDGSVYITDSGFNPGFEPSGSDAVYRIADGKVETVLASSELGGPNGVAVSDDSVWIVTFGSGELLSVADGAAGEPESLPTGSLDGLELHQGMVYASSWEGQSILRGTPGGSFEVVISGVEAPADIGIDAGRNRLLIPLFQSNEVRIIPIPTASSD